MHCHRTWCFLCRCMERISAWNRGDGKLYMKSQLHLMLLHAIPTSLGRGLHMTWFIDIAHIYICAKFNFINFRGHFKLRWRSLERLFYKNFRRSLSIATTPLLFFLSRGSSVHYSAEIRLHWNWQLDIQEPSFPSGVLDAVDLSRRSQKVRPSFSPFCLLLGSGFLQLDRSCASWSIVWRPTRPSFFPTSEL